MFFTSLVWKGGFPTSSVYLLESADDLSHLGDAQDDTDGPDVDLE